MYLIGSRWRKRFSSQCEAFRGAVEFPQWGKRAFFLKPSPSQLDCPRPPGWDDDHDTDDDGGEDDGDDDDEDYGDFEVLSSSLCEENMLLS